MRYDDAEAAIAWLCAAFGFEVGVVHADGGTVHHAQLVFGPGKTDMIMVSSKQDDDFGKLVGPPGPGARNQMSPYLIVEDADAHHARAVEHGAKIAYPLYSADYGGRGYSCYDPEGYLWNFGTYDPWTQKPYGYKPTGHTDVSPYLLVSDARKTVAFLEAALGATLLSMMETPDGRAAHTEVRVGDSVVMLGEPPGGVDGPGSHVHVYVPDVDAAYAAAIAAGGTSFQEPVQKHDPDRRAGVRDPFGTTWWLGTRVGHDG